MLNFFPYNHYKSLKSRPEVVVFKKIFCRNVTELADQPCFLPNSNFDFKYLSDISVSALSIEVVEQLLFWKNLEKTFPVLSNQDPK